MRFQERLTIDAGVTDCKGVNGDAKDVGPVSNRTLEFLHPGRP
jgi:hypothetical protein